MLKNVLNAVIVMGLASGPMSVSVQASAATPPPTPSLREHQYLSSSPPDLTRREGAAGRAPTKARRVPGLAGAFVIDASASASSGGGNEPSIAINPANPKQIAITRFNFNFWQNGNADLLYSDDGGISWKEESTVPTPGLTDAPNGPYDQSIDYGRDGRLYGAFLACSAPVTGPPAVPECNTLRVATGSTTDPTNASSWSWKDSPGGASSGTRTNVDQPWLLVNRDDVTANQDNAYTAYQDFGGNPDARVAVYRGANTANVSADNIAGTMNPLATNGGLRLAKDPRNGTMYALYQQSTGTLQPNSVLNNQPVNVTYRLNRSIDGGQHWTLNGNNDGVAVDTVNSDQGLGYKFGSVNALLGGVDHAAVDPSNGDVYVVYGADVSGNNQLRIRRLTDNGSGGLNVGAATNISTSTNAALPSVAVLDDGTIGVLYTTFDGNNTAGFPTFSAHLARSTDHGATFTDTLLQTFSSPEQTQTGCDTRPQPPNPNPPDLTCARQRVLGDYQQLKSVGNTFYGTFPGNTAGANPTSTPPIHALFFSVPQATQMTLASSANPSVYGQPVTFTATVKPIPDGGTVSFKVDGNTLGGPIAVNTTTGEATSSAVSTLSPGSHTVDATYSGSSNFKTATASLTQQVNKAPVVTTLSSSATSSAFGHVVTFTDTVCPGPDSTSLSSPPTGTVTIKDGSTVLGTPTLVPGGGANCSQVQVTSSNLLPGTHTITADYGGDGNYLPAGTETFTHTVSCTRTITGQVNGAVFATRESTCIIDATVRGGVSGVPGGALFISNSTIGGSVQSSNGTLFSICGSSVIGSVQVNGATGFVLIGDPGDDHCPGNRITTGSVQLTNNHAGAELVANNIGGSVQVSGTTGTGPFPADSSAGIVGNTIGGSLACAGNVPPPTNRGTPNTVTGSRTGQCAAL